ncbi:MAG: ribonuclease P protein component [bacterium]|nr:ribonuclease P protein component [bacterium]
MFSRRQRLPRDEFEALLRHGVRKKSTHLLVWVYSRTDGAPSRVAVSVSKKVCKKATDRNRLKRQLRSLVQKKHRDIPPESDMLISARGTCAIGDMDIELSELLQSFSL